LPAPCHRSRVSSKGERPMILNGTAPDDWVGSDMSYSPFGFRVARSCLYALSDEALPELAALMGPRGRCLRAEASGSSSPVGVVAIRWRRLRFQWRGGLCHGSTPVPGMPLRCKCLVISGSDP
jgi:hypothetical protein